MHSLILALIRAPLSGLLVVTADFFGNEAILDHLMDAFFLAEIGLLLLVELEVKLR